MHETPASPPARPGNDAIKLTVMVVVLLIGSWLMVKLIDQWF